MKKLHTFLVTLVLASLCATTFAQDRVMRLMKNGYFVFSFEISGSEKIVFQDPDGDTTPPSDDVLVVEEKNGTKTKTLLDKIKEIDFPTNNLSVILFTGTSVSYALNDLQKICFGKGGVGIASATLSNQITVYPNPTTGELRIENGEWRTAAPVGASSAKLINNVEIYDVYGRNAGANSPPIHWRGGRRSRTGWSSTFLIYRAASTFCKSTPSKARLIKRL